MKFSYKVVLLTVVAMMLNVAMCEETIEVTVDNVPKVEKVELTEQLKNLKAEVDKVETEIQTKTNVYEAEESELVKETAREERHLEKKEKSVKIWEKKLSNLHEEIQALKASIAELENKAIALDKPITFLDAILDLTYRYILPACEWIWSKIVEYFNLCKPYVINLWNEFVQFWNTNEYTQMIQMYTVKYWTISVNYISSLWNNTIYPKIIELYTPYAPKVNEMMNQCMTYITKYWNIIVDYCTHYCTIGYVWTVKQLSLCYEQLKANQYLSYYADFIIYMILAAIAIVLLHVAILVLHIVLFPLRWLCPCRCCKCCKHSK